MSDAENRIAQQLQKHIDEAAKREADALILAKLDEPLRLIRRELNAARERRDVAAEGILKAIGFAWIHRSGGNRG